VKAAGAVIDRGLLAQVRDRCQAVQREIAKAYIGSPDAVEVLLTALTARGHVLLEGVPGVAKTTLCKAFSVALGCSFRRIQFTPDLLPSDITGTHILDQRTHGVATGSASLPRSRATSGDGSLRTRPSPARNDAAPP